MAKTMKAKDLRRVSSMQGVAKFFSQFATYLFLVIMAVIILFPFYFMLISSVKSIPEFQRSVPTLFPEEIHLENYMLAFNQANLGQLFMNTLYVGVVSTLLSFSKSLFINGLLKSAFSISL